MATRRRAVARGDGTQGPKAERARAFRREQTPSEEVAWDELRRKRCLGLKFRRQQVIDGFIVDFYCDAARLVVEIDGGIHDDPAVLSRDERRTEALERRGLRVLRVRAEEVMEGGLTARIARTLGGGEP